MININIFSKNKNSDKKQKFAGGDKIKIRSSKEIAQGGGSKPPTRS